MRKFKIEMVIVVSDFFNEDDLNIQPDSVIDGFQITRTERLGDLTSQFHMTDIESLEVEEIKE